MSRTPKIITFFGLEEFPVSLPWDVPSNADLRVFFGFSDGSEQETSDFVVTNDQLSLLTEPECIKSITVACVPCPELELPKFGKIPNEDIETAFNQLLDRVAYLEARQGQKLGTAFGVDLDCWDGMVAGFKDGQIVPVSPHEVHFSRAEFFSEAKELECVPHAKSSVENVALEGDFLWCSSPCVPLAALDENEEFPWPYESVNLGKFNDLEFQNIQLLDWGKPDCETGQIAGCYLMEIAEAHCG